MPKGVFKRTDEHRAAISRGLLGHATSAIARQRISATGKGRKHSEETKLKMSSERFLFPSNLRHGLRHTRIYKVYQNIRGRQLGKDPRSAKNYSHVRCEWDSFEDFFRDMGSSYYEHVKIHGEKNTTIDRIDNRGNYSKENCRWATRGIQVRNSSQNVWVRYKGEVFCLTDWSKKLGIKMPTLRARLLVSKWLVEDAFETPVTSSNK